MLDPCKTFLCYNCDTASLSCFRKNCLNLCYNVPVLLEFNVSNNRLSDLPEELGVMTSLVTLNMAANGFKRLPEVLLRMGSLRTLQAENNDISGKYLT